MRNEALVAQLWRQQSVWSQTAGRMKSAIARARALGLGLSITGAVCGTLAGAVAHVAPALSTVLAVAAAVAVGLLPLVRPRYTGNALQDWTRARSVSEALKSEVFLYLAGAGAYRDTDRDAQLARTTDDVCRKAVDLLPQTIDVTPADRPLPPVDGEPSYFDVRVRSQVEGYYRPQAGRLHRRLRGFRRLQAGLSVIAVVLGALAAQFSTWGLGPWIAVITTTTATVAAYVAASRYEYQVLEYTRTADELTRLLTDGHRATAPGDLDKVITDAERLISSQNGGWMAKLSTEPDLKENR